MESAPSESVCSTTLEGQIAVRTLVGMGAMDRNEQAAPDESSLSRAVDVLDRLALSDHPEYQAAANRLRAGLSVGMLACARRRTQIERLDACEGHCTPLVSEPIVTG